jgi:sugar lactone lactonase YvrE
MQKHLAGRVRSPRFRNAALSLLALWLNIAVCSAVETKFWQHDDKADFEKGALHQLSLRSDGRLYLAPEFPEVFDSSTPYLWAIATDKQGNVYTAGGGTGGGAAKLFVIDPAGKSRVLAELEGLEIHAIALDARGRVFAATDPDGKVYKIGADGKAQLFYDPRAKYIWAMAFDSKGALYLATGDSGEVHRVTPDGAGAVFFRTGETHARSLTVDSHDNIILGTEPGGLILRVSPAGEGYVLYQAPKREITSVAAAQDGSIYAAAVGNKSASSPVMSAPVNTPAAAPATATPPATGAATVAPVAPHPAVPPPSLASATPAIAGGSEVYRIDATGAPRRIWTNAQDLVYAIAFDSAGKPLLGTGNTGKVYRLDSDSLSTLLVDASPTQVTGFASGSQGRIYAITGNIGKVYRIGPGQSRAGSYESDVLDAGAFSQWGRLNFRGTPANAAVMTRSGNLNRPQANWSPWTPLQPDGVPECAVCGSGRIASPPARFLQYEIALAAGSNDAAALSSVEIAYLPKNIAPVVEQIEITPSNYKFQVANFTPAPATNITLPPMGPRRRVSTPAIDVSSSQTMTYAKGFLGVRWMAADENGDSLSYKVEIRGSDETGWTVLKDNWKEKSLSWDSAAFPDGEYVVRVTASDAPGNPPGEALTSSLISEPFLIDNTPPRIDGLAATASGGRIEVRWKATDARSNITKAEYSLNGGDWTLVEPVTRLSDSPVEEYRLTIPRASPGEQVIAVRVNDEYDNQTAAKVIVK